MTDTIESFVAKLQKEGVEAGQAEAQKISEQAEEKARQIIAEAEQKAEKIVADAETRGREIVEHANTEMTLAARDTAASLRDTLADCLKQLVSSAAEKTLEDTDYIRETLREIITLYTQADIAQKSGITINVQEGMQAKLQDWAIKELGAGIEKNAPEIRGKLQQAGFEYEVSGGTIEVTLDAVVEILSGMVTPALREALAGKTEA